MAVNPAISIGLTPGGLFVQAAQPFRDNTLIFLFFVPDRTFGFIHHFIGADYPVIGQVQEIAER
jgi:hypothetical protein